MPYDKVVFKKSSSKAAWESEVELLAQMRTWGGAGMKSAPKVIQTFGDEDPGYIALERVFVDQGGPDHLSRIKRYMEVCGPYSFLFYLTSFLEVLQKHQIAHGHITADDLMLPVDVRDRGTMPLRYD